MTCRHRDKVTELARSGEEKQWQTWCVKCGARLALDTARRDEHLKAG